MKSLMAGVVWTAVLAGVLGAVALVLALVGWAVGSDRAMLVGVVASIVSVAFAVLALRESETFSL